MKKTLIAAAAVITLTAACTPSEFAAWTAWRSQDPAAAEAFAEEWKAAHAAQQENTERANQTGGTVWDRLAWCESGGQWGYNGSSGYDGGLQFLPASWRNYGGRDFAEYAWQASREEQIIVAERILDDVGWGAWPACSRRLGLR